MKNKYTYIWVSLVVLVFGIIFIPKIVNRINSDTVTQQDRLNASTPDSSLSFITLNGEKRMIPNFSFYNQDSLVISQEDYLGKVFLVEFFFTSCPTICPIMNQNLVEIQNEFRDFENFGIASFTINPEYDTPIVLKEYAEEYGITDMDWHLLTGDAEEIYDLANNGFNIFAMANENVPGGFEHSGLFALVDKQGYIRSRRDDFGNPIIYYRGMISEGQQQNEQGEEEQIKILKEDIRKLLKENVSK